MNENIMPMAVEDIDITPTAATIDSNGGLLLFTLNHYENWELTNKPDWCEVSPTTGGSGEYQIEVTVSANELTEERSGNVEFSAGGGYAEGYVHIVQEAKQPEPAGKSPVRIGGLEIKKAYLGNMELTSKNAFIGGYNLIGGGDEIDYFYMQLDEASPAAWHIDLDDSIVNNGIKYSFDKSNWDNDYTIIESSATVIIDSIDNIVKLFPNRVLPIVFTGSTTVITGLTSENIEAENEGYFCTCELYKTSSKAYFCLIMNNDLSTYSNINFSFYWKGSKKTVSLSESQYSGVVSGTYNCLQARVTGFGSIPILTWSQINDSNLYLTFVKASYDGIPQKTYLDVDISKNKIYFKATNNTSSSIFKGVDKRFKIGGNIQSLFNYEDMNEETSPNLKNMFSYLITLTDASNLHLNYTTLTNDCYNSMFRDCTSLTKAPILPAINVFLNCYTNMFYNCSSLNEIHIYANYFESNSLKDWVYGVSSTGNIYCKEGVEYPSGDSGIPEGWARHDI